MEGSREPWRLGHRPALDGLRGVAILLVIADHFGYAPKGTGSAGVALFFTLSGFLITRTILEARDAGHWSYRSFLCARFVRLFPALLLMASAVASLRLLGGLAFDPRTIAALLYLGNFAALGSALDHAWSLAVEEQFYLVWPLALGLLLRGRNPVRLAAGVAVISVVLRFTIGDFETAYRSLPTNAFALLAGCALALVAPRLRPLPNWVGVVTTASIALVAWPIGSFLVVPVATVVLAVPAVWAATSMSAPRPLRFAGRISYAWYLWHYPVVVLFGLTSGGWAEAAGVVATGVVAVGSTLLIEEPLRRAWRARSAKELAGHVSRRDVQRPARLLVDEMFDVVGCREQQVNGGGIESRVGGAG
jgi:peptidoglycan/LPS O-acetylase OafA/YrhL